MLIEENLAAITIYKYTNRDYKAILKWAKTTAPYVCPISDAVVLVFPPGSPQLLEFVERFGVIDIDGSSIISPDEVTTKRTRRLLRRS